jgi:hypothetical protein
MIEIYKHVHACIFLGQALPLQNVKLSIGVIISRKMKQFAKLHVQGRKLENNEYYGWGSVLPFVP